ncbi:hypothetical protein GGH18_006156, partial [Coemansia sp. RSA 530]
VPYVLYSKSDKVSRAANWISPPDARDTRDNRNRNRRDFNQQTYGSNSASAFVYQAAEDEETFSLVDKRGMAAKKMAVRGMGRGGFSGRGRGRGAGMQRLGRGGARGAMQGGFRRRFRWRDDPTQHHRMTSVKPEESWELVQGIEFSRMADLSFSAREARVAGMYGSVGVYDHAFDRVTTRLEKPLRASGAVRYNATAREDPVLAQQTDVKVFATDSVLATLMAATVSTSAWDVVVNRVGSSLYLDKREGGPIDFPSVNENAAEPPADSGEKDASINLAPMLAMEARDINSNYIRQITGKSRVEYEANPFGGSGETPDDSAYKY